MKSDLRRTGADIPNRRVPAAPSAYSKSVCHENEPRSDLAEEPLIRCWLLPSFFCTQSDNDLATRPTPPGAADLDEVRVEQTVKREGIPTDVATKQRHFSILDPLETITRLPHASKHYPGRRDTPLTVTANPSPREPNDRPGPR
jgi:hypothetical protein